MKAFRIVEPGRTDIVDVPECAPPGVGEVRLRVARIGFCGTDLGTFRGKSVLTGFPRIPGHEVSGVVEECGPGVPEALRPGASVFVVPYQNCGRCSACRRGRVNACRGNQTLGVQRDGAARERINVPATKLLTRPGLSLREMALVEPQSIGVHAVTRGRVAASDTVAVLGSGGVGLGAIAASARRGARVIAVDVDERKLELARRAGAAATVNSSAGDPRVALLDLTGGDGPLVVIEAAGQAETYRLAFEAVAFAGRVVCLGYAAADLSLTTRYFVLKELDITGSRNATPADFEEAAAAIAEGRLPKEALETREVSLAGAGAALAAWSASAAGGAKIHLDFSL